LYELGKTARELVKTARELVKIQHFFIKNLIYNEITIL